MYGKLHTAQRSLGAVVLTAILTTACLARAEDAPGVAEDVAALSPYIGQTTVLVVKVDPARLAAPDFAALLKPAEPQDADRFARWKLGADAGIAALRDLTGGRPAYATVGIPISLAEWPAFAFFRPAPGADLQAVAGRLKTAVEAFNPVETCVRGDTIVAVPVRNLDIPAALDALAPTPRAGLDAALQAVAAYPIQVLVLPPDYVRRTIVELMPQLPRELGGGPSTVLTDGVVWMAIGLDPAQVHAEIIVQSTSEEAARRFAEFVPSAMQTAYDTIPALRAQVPQELFQAIRAAVAPTVEGDRVALLGNGPESTAEIVRLVATVSAALQEQVRRNSDSDKFKQILLAMHNYYDAYQSFPPRDPARDAQGKPGLSWRVHILPFVDEQALYQEFHLDEPWDSPHNKALIPRMPKVFQSRIFGVAPGHTTFLAPVGEGTVFGGTKATKFSDITDGTSNTVALVEVKPERAVPWTAPQDYAFDPAQPAGGLQVNSDGRFLCAFADGAVCQLRGDAKPENLLLLFLMSDGKVVDYDTVR